MIFLTTDHTLTAVTTLKNPSVLGKSHLTHLTTDAMFSGQRFAILGMFFLTSDTQHGTCDT